jgi:hypothetical protein
MPSVMPQAQKSGAPAKSSSSHCTTPKFCPRHGTAQLKSAAHASAALSIIFLTTG